jgi:hypothetical protein
MAANRQRVRDLVRQTEIRDPETGQVSRKPAMPAPTVKVTGGWTTYIERPARPKPEHDAAAS